MNRKETRLIPALDVTDMDEAAALVGEVAPLEMVYGFKVGFGLGLSHGLPAVVERIRQLTDKPVIYDHQKAATDIPATGALFARTLAAAGLDEAILFPQAGPGTLEAWTEALVAKGLKVIVGGVMTHPGYLVSEGGFLDDEAVSGIYLRARQLGVRSFVLPLTRPELCRRLCEQAGIGGGCELYSPGLGRQGGDPERFDFIERLYLIVGRSLREAADRVGYVNKLALCQEKRR